MTEKNTAQRDSRQPTASDQPPDRAHPVNTAIQYCVGLENKPGTFAKLCAALAKMDVDVRALFVSEEGKYSWVHLIGHPTSSTEHALNEGGYKFFTEKVLTVRVDDQRGELERIANRLAEAGVNISYIYGSGAQGSEFTLVLNTTDVELAARSLGI
jgi:hypothetical protein